jgi:hypothetical protein
MANFSAVMDVQQAATQTQVYSGLYNSLCTIQQPDGLLTTDGAPSGNYVDVAGLVDIPCMDAVLSDGSIQATEARELEEIMSKSYRHVSLNGFYPKLITGAVFAGGPGGQALGWQAIVDGVTFNLLGAEGDSQGTQTRLKLQLVTISNQGAQ